MLHKNRITSVIVVVALAIAVRWHHAGRTHHHRTRRSRRRPRSVPLPHPPKQARRCLRRRGRAIARRSSPSSDRTPRRSCSPAMPPGTRESRRLRHSVRAHAPLGPDHGRWRNTLRRCQQLCVSDSARRDAAGRWSFDTAAGRDEVLARRIGNNELAAIAALGGIAEAQQQYAGRPRDGSKGKEYARRFVSAPGTQDGLYWPASAGTTAAGLARRSRAGCRKGRRGRHARAVQRLCVPHPREQGNTAKSGGKDIGGRLTEGFAVVAYPVDYRNSGIMTFMIGTDGIVYQKDLGEKTPDIGSTMTEYNPRDGWAPVITGEQTSGKPGTP